jgi:hypothetical protein
MSKTIKVFISQGMSDKSNEEIKAVRQKLKKIYLLFFMLRSKLLIVTLRVKPKIINQYSYLEKLFKNLARHI